MIGTIDILLAGFAAIGSVVNIDDGNKGFAVTKTCFGVFLFVLGAWMFIRAFCPPRI